MLYDVPDLAAARRYVATVRWQYARTMPQWPHEYTVKEWRPDLAEDFAQLCRLIARCGVREPWPPPPAAARYHHPYLTIDGKKYWAMGPHGDSDPPEQMTVINRAEA